MLILVFFAFLAGIATILAPCILPILPIVLSAGVTGGKKRPLGIVLGLVISFTFFTLALSYLTKYLGLDPALLRTIAITILLLFGVLLLIPKLLVAFEVLVTKLLPKTGQNAQRKDFLGGVLIGFSLGLVWTPCVGPIVGSVIALAATNTINVISILIIVAYAIGTCIPLLLIIYGSKTLLQKIKRLNTIAPQIQKGFGVVMIVTALAMLLGVDQLIQNNLLAKLPSSISTGITQQLEQSTLVQDQLNALQGRPTMTPSPIITTKKSSGLPILGKAPELQGITNWLNSKPLTIAELKGKVVLIDFWTYSCINCIRTLPHVTGWYDKYKDQGLVVIGVHSPEFAFEHNTDNVADAINNFNIDYPVAQDNDFATWHAFYNQYWPAEYLIDADGNIRATHFGEGKYDESENNIRALLLEAKEDLALPDITSTPEDQTPNRGHSPETYLGIQRRANYQPDRDPNQLRLNQWTLAGDWITDKEFVASTEGSSLSYRFNSKNVYLVLTPQDANEPGNVQVFLDNQPITLTQSGKDLTSGGLLVDTDRLYHLVALPNTEEHLLTLKFTNSAIKAFAFTFG